MRAFSLLVLAIYSVLAFILIVFPNALANTSLSWFADWWGMFTVGCIICQFLPVFFFVHYRNYSKDTWKWDWQSADAFVTYTFIVVVALAAPAIAKISGEMIFWQHKIWLYSFAAAIMNFAIARVEQKLEEMAPAPPAPAPAAAPAAGGPARAGAPAAGAANP